MYKCIYVRTQSCSWSVRESDRTEWKGPRAMQPSVACGRKVTAHCSSGCRTAAGKQGWLQANRGGCRQTGVAAGKQGWLSKLSLMGSTGLLQTIIPPLLVHLKLSFHSYPFSSFLLIVLKLYFTFTGCPETTLPLLLVVLNLFVYFYWSP